MKVRLDTTTRKQKEQALEWVKRSVLPVVVKNVEAILLLQLHDELGFGKKRLQRFFDGTAPRIMQILDYYNWDKDQDAIWLCEKRLKEEIGIDVNEINFPFSGELDLR